MAWSTKYIQSCRDIYSKGIGHVCLNHELGLYILGNNPTVRHFFNLFVSSNEVSVLLIKCSFDHINVFQAKGLRSLKKRGEHLQSPTPFDVFIRVRVNAGSRPENAHLRIDG